MPIINPYANVNWGSVKYLKSNSHLHNGNRDVFMKSYTEHGQRHFPIINYQPSHITYPLADFITSVPPDAIGSPASEKVKTSNNGEHFNGIGSFYNSPGHNWKVEIDGPFLSWQEKFNKIFSQLQFPDGGGITLNHPVDQNLEKRIEMLQYDKRVLGIEIYNDSCDWETTAPYYVGFSKDKFVPLWDKILAKGVRCWGFASIDWFAPPERGWQTKGWSKLLVNQLTEYDALKAYRDGNFFAVILDTGLVFTNIALSGRNLTIATNKATKLKLVTDKRTTEISSSSTTFNLDGNEIYARVEASDAEGGYIYSNPIMFKSIEDIKREKQKKKIRNIIILGS